MAKKRAVHNNNNNRKFSNHSNKPHHHINDEPFPELKLTPKNSNDNSSDDPNQRSRTNSLFSVVFDKISNPKLRKDGSKGFSLYKLLLLELNLQSENVSSDINPQLESQNDTSYEELRNMIKIPYHLEKFMIFGLMVCFNSFLSLFTLAPLKIIIVMIQQLYHYCGPSRKTFEFQRFRLIKKDVITLSLIFFALIVLSNKKLDISRMYHDVRGQTDIKLYVMFGVLECAEKLCSSIGQDILNILYGSSTSRKTGRFVVFYFLSIFYLSFHAYILVYQTVSLNVAANSYSNALMTLLLSNQFGELKGSVFKKFEREGLFQITMADLSERFQLSLMLGIIALRNLMQLSVTGGLIPNSWKSWNRWIGAVFGPGVVVIGSEVFVDWLKHCYIVKFNKIKPKIYKNFLYVSCLDFLEVFGDKSKNGKSSHEFTDYISLTRRIGLPLLASVVCYLRMTLPDLKSIFIFPDTGSKTYAVIGSTTLIGVTFLTLLLVRVILSMVIFKIANVLVVHHKQHQDELRKKMNQSRAEGTPPPAPALEDVSNDSFSSDVSNYASTPLGLSYLPGSPNTEPSTINPKTRAKLYDVDERIPPTVEEKRNKQLLNGALNELSWTRDNGDEGLSNVSRYKMSSKRIW
ncbi:EMP65 Endoplasmic reticulum membrane protein 65 [Candida maltosa Xu316]